MKQLLWIMAWCTGSTLAQGGNVSLDGSLGPKMNVKGPTFVIPANWGARQGGNLFQSFGKLDLSKGETVDFTGPASVRNILARVTGGPSSIDGTIQSEIPHANLFLLNPSGIVFGSNAKVNVGGSFSVGTANDLTLGKTGRFASSIGGNSVLTSAPVSAFGFTTSHPAAIKSSGLAVRTSGGSINVIGGDVSFRGGQLAASGGNISILSAQSRGQVGYNPRGPGSLTKSTLTAYGQATFQQSTLTATGLGQGKAKIDVRGGAVTLEKGSTLTATGRSPNPGVAVKIQSGSLLIDGGSNVSSTVGETGRAGDISVQTGRLLLRGGGEIDSSTTSNGRAGNIRVKAENLTITGPGSRIASEVGEGDATGTGGSLDVTVTHALSIRDEGQIETTTLSSRASGQAGDVNVRAGTLTINGFGLDLPTGIFSETGTIDLSSPSMKGAAGAVEVKVTHGAKISASGAISNNSFTAGNAGNVDFHADSLLIDGSSDGNSHSTIGSGVGGSGQGGGVKVDVSNRISLRSGGSIIAVTRSSAPAGSVDVQARRIGLSGEGTQISSSSQPFQGFLPDIEGDPGHVTVTADRLELLPGSEINANTFSPLQGGIVTVDVGSMLIRGGETVTPTGVFAQSVNRAASSTGTAGSIKVHVDRTLRIESGGLISGDTLTSGTGGDVAVQAGTLLIDGTSLGGDPIPTGITSAAHAGSTGNAGNVQVMVGGKLVIRNLGYIEANTGAAGTAGKVDVVTGSFAIIGANSSPSNDPTGIDASSEYGAAPQAAGGHVSVDVSGQISLRDGGEIKATTFSSANAGTVTIQAGRLEIDGTHSAGIQATAIGADSGVNDTDRNHPLLSGVAGQVTVDVTGGLILRGTGAITASSYTEGAAGKILVHAGSLIIDGSATPEHPTGIASESGFDPFGPGGYIGVTVDGGILIKDSGSISTNTHSSQDGGSIVVRGKELTIDGAHSSHETGIDSSSQADAGGNGGKVDVRISGAIQLRDGGNISAFTLSSGTAGDVAVRAGSIFIDGLHTVIGNVTGIDSSSGTTGNAGTVLVNAPRIFIANFGQIGASSGSGIAGDVTVQVGTLVLDNAPLGVNTQTFGPGQAGDVTVNAGDIFLHRGSNITSYAKAADAGTVTLSALHRIDLDGGSGIITASTGQAGGNIDLRVGTLLYLLDSGIISSAHGDGGNISIDPRFVVLNNSLISANSTSSTGGNITIAADNFLDSNTPITATGALANGSISITAPSLDLVGDLHNLSGALVDNSQQLQETCSKTLQDDFSTFRVTSQGGLEINPTDFQLDLPGASEPESPASALSHVDSR